MSASTVDSSTFRRNMVALKDLEEWSLGEYLEKVREKGYTGDVEAPIACYGKFLWAIIKCGGDKKLGKAGENYEKAQEAWDIFEIERDLFHFPEEKIKELITSPPPTTKRPNTRKVKESSPPEAVEDKPTTPPAPVKEPAHKPVPYVATRKPPIRGFCTTKKFVDMKTKGPVRGAGGVILVPPPTAFVKHKLDEDSGSDRPVKKSTEMFYKKRIYCNA